MSSDTDLDSPKSHAIADGWLKFAETILPTVSGNDHAQAHIAFSLWRFDVLQIVQEVVADRSVEAATLALRMLDAELEQFIKSHASVIQ